ncbi:MAG: hypothetical protein U0T56_10480 [Ferruginibacter sp.]|jgi:hypothetical protein
MKRFKSLFLPALIYLFGTSCCSSVKQPVSVVPQDTPSVQKDTIPACVSRMISAYKAEEKQNPPRQIIQYNYHGKTVYYVTPPCCDFFSELYDSNCVLIAYPDGGITGKGDGRAADFIDVRTDEKLIWKDDRK